LPVRLSHNPSVRIIDLIDESDGFEALLLPVASSSDRLEAFRGQRLLELVRFLQSRGSVPVAIGTLVFPEFRLSPSNPANKVQVTVWVDWPDYGPVEDGLPKTAYYRLDIRRGNAALSENARADSPEEAERVIWRAFGWMR